MYPCNQFSKMSYSRSFITIYEKLFANLGPQHWWPADNKFETIIGAILTQAVSWTNVEKAISNLKLYNNKLNGSQQLSPALIRDMQLDRLAELIRPSGYYNMKARKIKAFCDFLDQKYQGSLKLMFSAELADLRYELLQVYGIGQETADSILLYAGNFPVFVVDAYSRRVFSRMGVIEQDISYQNLQELIMGSFPPDVKKYNEYHALIVELGKNTCAKKNPGCQRCPLAASF